MIGNNARHARLMKMMVMKKSGMASEPVQPVKPKIVTGKKVKVA